eukprot:2328009-Pleurochrysis_carterae.AAC.1
MEGSFFRKISHALARIARVPLVRTDRLEPELCFLPLGTSKVQDLLQCLRLGSWTAFVHVRQASLLAPTQSPSTRAAMR